jgi:acyl transferase domain-containing protein
VEGIDLHPPRIPYLSNVGGDFISQEEATDPGYWVKHIRRTVRFSDGLQKPLRNRDAIFLEVGPGRTLGTLARRHPEFLSTQVVLPSLPHADEHASQAELISTTLARLWLGGLEIDWAAYHAQERRRRLPLPTYPFERKRYWIEASETAPGTFAAAAAAAVQPGGALEKRTDVADWFYVPSWRRSVAPPCDGPSLIPDSSSCCLLVTNSPGVGPRLRRRLQEEGWKVVSAGKGSASREPVRGGTVSIRVRRSPGWRSSMRSKARA